MLIFIEENGQVKVGITYSKADDAKIIIDNTKVSIGLRSENIDKGMIKLAMDYDRKNGLEVIPLYPVAISVIQGNNSLQNDLV
ncbi:MAG TPA: N-acetyltransferase [Balneolaceae bacterium]|nr:N-acetyltransferase [Balneolaceae bacterium]